mmetsp:Transcript_47106/g.74379  ORF Transcript_47106/g.74379 Transcript_47106/m.74379 type:complete len:236 (-) Transcript_47106:1350-2057(-)
MHQLLKHLPLHDLRTSTFVQGPDLALRAGHLHTCCSSFLEEKCPLAEISVLSHRPNKLPIDRHCHLTACNHIKCSTHLALRHDFFPLAMLCENKSSYEGVGLLLGQVSKDRNLLDENYFASILHSLIGVQLSQLLLQCRCQSFLRQDSQSHRSCTSDDLARTLAIVSLKDAFMQVAAGKLHLAIVAHFRQSTLQYNGDPEMVLHNFPRWELFDHHSLRQGELLCVIELLKHWRPV